MRTVTIVGARPQFIKSWAVSAALQAAGIDEVIVHTGQHYDECLSSRFFAELGLRAPDHHLGIGSVTHGQQTGRMLEAAEGVLSGKKPDWVVVYGDTNSAFAGALFAAKRQLFLSVLDA
jgi:UDP-N-acetylglucosamine 2-epimerase